VQIKNNLGPRAESLAYEIVGDEQDATLEWGGISELTSADLLAPDAAANRCTTIASAEDFLRNKLREGPVLVKKLCAESGFNERTLERAAKKIGVIKSRASAGGAWMWDLA
jgi:hypothetical protein